jgi:protein TonB
LFKEYTSKKKRNLGIKLIIFPASAILHLSLFLFLTVSPLLKIKNLPHLEIYRAFLAPPLAPPPPPPPPPPPLGTSAKVDKVERKKRIKPVRITFTSIPGRLIAPLEIPDEIAEGELLDIGVENGEEGGVAGGVKGGVVGGVPGGVIGGVLGGILDEEFHSPLRIEGQYRPPRLVKRIKPHYPEIARQARVSGVVLLEATTDFYGRVKHVKVLRSIELLDSAAVDAVKQWIYEPMFINGKPRSVIFTVSVNFVLVEKRL